MLLALVILIYSNKRGGVRTIALRFADGCSALLTLPQAAVGKGSRQQPPRPPPPGLFGAGPERKASPGRPRVTTDCWATYYHLYLQKLVDFPPQLNRLTASEIGFEFLV